VACIEFDIRADAPPDAIREALLDFSERRPELWPGLPADQYEVYEVGEAWAEIREGYRGPIWVRERYEWSAPGQVRFTVVDSGFARPGSYVVVEIEPAPGGGSTLHITWVRWGKGLFGKVFVGLMVLTRGAAIRRSFTMGLARMAATNAAR
jgi:polyketide cyclase/dehydrase/lipid transport protein